MDRVRSDLSLNRPRLKSRSGHFPDTGRPTSLPRLELSAMFTIAVVLVLLALVVLGARWLFRQRTPDEIRAARAWLKRTRNR